MTLSYADANLGAALNPDPALVRDLQKHLRALGYLRRTIDGQFGTDTRLATRRLQFDLLHNHGGGTDGIAPVAMILFNRGVTAITGIVDRALADSIEGAIGDPRMTLLPESHDPKADNQAAMQAVISLASPVAPAPFLLAIFQQESSNQHFVVPRPGDSDTFITIGLDTNGATTDQVTSRGYGIGQYTLGHHPPRAEEVHDVMLDPARNVQRAFAVLRGKLDEVTAKNSTSIDRQVEHPILDQRQCRYGPGDPRRMRACKECARETGKVDITPATPLYHGSTQTYGQANFGVPDRAQILCDWPYAVRRYNGDGPSSYNYQARILLNLLAGPDVKGSTP